jgi:mannitol/fructose-specific phosphotransferase system IIA component (Ntr-type)
LTLTSLLRPDRINLDLKAKKKPEALRELVQMIRQGDDAELLLATLTKREELGSTGIGKGIAIPHGRSLLIDKLEMAVGRSAKGVEYDSIDHLITLGRVAMVCQELTKKKRLFDPQTPDELIELVRSLEEKIR